MIMACKLDHIHPVQKILLKINVVHQIGSMEISFLPYKAPKLCVPQNKVSKNSVHAAIEYTQSNKEMSYGAMIRSRGRLSVLKKPHPRRFQRHGILEKANVYRQKKSVAVKELMGP